MRYRSISVFRLGGWSPLLPTRFLVPRGTLDTTPYPSLRLPGSHRLWLRFPPDSTSSRDLLVVLNPGAVSRSGLGFARFARRYWGHLF